MRPKRLTARVRPEITQRRRESFARTRSVSIPHRSVGHAEATVHCATIDHEQPRPIRVTPHEMGRHQVGFLAERVAEVPRDLPGLVDPRDSLASNRIGRTARVDQGEVMRRVQTALGSAAP